MKQRIMQQFLVLVVLLSASFFVIHTSVSAQSGLEQKHIEKIQQNCVTAQTTMQRVQKSDLATRINFGRAYDALMTKLMEPLNTRAVANRAPVAPALAEKTTNLEVNVETFRDHYAEYNNKLNETIRIDCRKHPEAFYALAVESKKLRAQLAQDITILKRITNLYQQDIIDYQKNLQQGTAQ